MFSHTSLLLLAAVTAFTPAVVGQQRQVAVTGSSIQVLHLSPTAGQVSRVARGTAGVMPGLSSEQKVLMAREALGPSGGTVNGAEAPIRITAVAPRVPGRAWIHLNNGTLLAGEGSEGMFRIGGESSYLGLTLFLSRPTQPHLLQCLVQGKPGVTTVTVHAGAVSMQTSVQPGWHHVGWLLYPEGAGQYNLEIAPGPHFLLEVRYCEITPFN
jgi:hypothetical protein